MYHWHYQLWSQVHKSLQVANLQFRFWSCKSWIFLYLWRIRNKLSLKKTLKIHDTRYMRHSCIVYIFKMKSLSKVDIFGLIMMVKSVMFFLIPPCRKLFFLGGVHKLHLQILQIFDHLPTSVYIGWHLDYHLPTTILVNVYMWNFFTPILNYINNNK